MTLIKIVEFTTKMAEQTIETRHFDDGSLMLVFHVNETDRHYMRMGPTDVEFLRKSLDRNIQFS